MVYTSLGLGGAVVRQRPARLTAWSVPASVVVVSLNLFACSSYAPEVRCKGFFR